MVSLELQAKQSFLLDPRCLCKKKTGQSCWTVNFTRDLIAMKVLLKETGDLVGTVQSNVFDNAASDLLQVMLNTSYGAVVDSGSSGALVWIPFVEAIVPDVGLEQKSNEDYASNKIFLQYQANQTFKDEYQLKRSIFQLKNLFII
ncbi:hypothetical protein QQ045_023084 [Rhodiola kirilowii]